MNKSCLNKNLAALKKSDPSLHKKIASLKGSQNYQVLNSKSGVPTLINIQGTKKQIHSNYDPIAEASRYLKTLNADESMNFIVVGFGLGYQTMELVKKASSLDKIFIFEKDPELFALAIREIDLTAILEHPGVKLFVDVNPLAIDPLLDSEKINFTLNKYCLVRQNSLIEGDLKFYRALLGEIDKYYKESQINLKTQSIHSKLYNKNIFSNLKGMLESSGINSLKDHFIDVPAIICSAGPSLDKNIQLLKAGRNKFFLIAVATALKPLLLNKIQPDIVISIDPDDLTINSFNLNSDTADIWLVHTSTIPNVITKSFGKRKLTFDSELYLAEWVKKYTEEKGNLGKISSVAHAATKLAQHLGCSPITLVGQDLSFCKQRQHCRHSFYHEGHLNKVTKLNSVEYWDNVKLSNYGPNLTQSLDIFGKSIVSTLAMTSYNHIFTKNFSGYQNIINATEGGMPVQGVLNLTLREVLYNFKELTDAPKLCFDAALQQGKTSFKPLKTSMLLQIKILEDIFGKMRSLESNSSNSKELEPENKQLFITEMEKIYKNILENKETALLLQGFDFAGFSNWYELNCQQIRKKELSKDLNLLDEEFDRDSKLMKVILEAVEYMMVNFKKHLPR
jgi:hypothetical protein